MYPNLTYLYFNAYLLKSIYFKCRIIEISELQDLFLRSLYKMIILKKLGLGATFPQLILYIRQNIMGVRLIKLSIAIAMLVSKLYIGNRRDKTRVRKLISIIDEKLTIENRLSLIEIEKDRMPNNQITWNKSVKKY